MLHYLVGESMEDGSKDGLREIFPQEWNLTELDYRFLHEVVIAPEENEKRLFDLLVSLGVGLHAPTRFVSQSK
jgi:hypothetical protein